MLLDKYKMLRVLTANPSFVDNMFNKAREYGLQGIFYAMIDAPDEQGDGTVGVKLWPSVAIGRHLGHEYNQFRGLVDKGLLIALRPIEGGFERVTVTPSGVIKPHEQYLYESGA